MSWLWSKTSSELEREREPLLSSSHDAPARRRQQSHSHPPASPRHIGGDRPAITSYRPRSPPQSSSSSLSRSDSPSQPRPVSFHSVLPPPQFVPSTDDNSLFAFVMEKVGGSSKLSGILHKLETDNEPGLSTGQLMLVNEDLKPVPPEKRLWGPWNFVAFWISDSFNINTWMISGSGIVNGLAWWQSWICVWIGYAIAACFVCMTGRIGATYHISFPVVNRSSFGIWGSLWPVFNRAAMACIWYGVQAWIGGTCVYLMIRAIWNSWRNDNIGVTGEGLSGTNTVDFVSFFLFWAFSLPAIWFPVQTIRHLFTVKSIVVPIAGVAFFIWAVVRAKGIGPIVHQPAKISGSKLAWEMVKGIMSAIANFATLIVNDPDFARFATKPKDAFWSQLITIPVGFAITSFIGIIVSSSSTVIFKGDPIWSPLTLLEKFLEEGGSGQRFGVFMIAFAFALAQLGTNIAANSVSAGTDLTALLPRFINIRRGGYICALVGLVMCPWNLLKDTNSFTTYLSAYSVFLSSIAGVMISDYYFVRKGYLEAKELYTARRNGPYFFTWGVHWRGYAAYIAGILINVLGFADAVGAKGVPKGATYIYNLNFFAGFIVAAGVYWILCKISSVPATSDTWCEVGDEIRELSVADMESGSHDMHHASGYGTGYDDNGLKGGHHGGNGVFDSKSKSAHAY